MADLAAHGGGSGGAGAGATAAAALDEDVAALAMLKLIAAAGAMFPGRSDHVETQLTAGAKRFKLRSLRARRDLELLASEYGVEAVDDAAAAVARAHVQKSRAGHAVVAEGDGGGGNDDYGATSAEVAFDTRKRDSALLVARDMATLAFCAALLGALEDTSAAACGHGGGACTERAVVVMETDGGMPLPLCSVHDREVHEHFPLTTRHALERVVRSNDARFVPRPRVALRQLRPGEFIERVLGRDQLRTRPLQVPTVPRAPCGACGEWACREVVGVAESEASKTVCMASPSGVYDARFVLRVECVTCKSERSPADTAENAAPLPVQRSVATACAVRDALLRRCGAAELAASELANELRAAEQNRDDRVPGAPSVAAFAELRRTAAAADSVVAHLRVRVAVAADAAAAALAVARAALARPGAARSGAAGNALGGLSRGAEPVLTVTGGHASLLVSRQLLLVRELIERARQCPMPGGEFMRLCGSASTLASADASNVRRMLELSDAYRQLVVRALCAHTDRCPMCGGGRGAQREHSDFCFKALRRNIKGGVPALYLKLPNDWLVQDADAVAGALPQAKRQVFRLSCSTWTAAHDTNRPIKGLDITALGVSCCAHRYISVAMPVTTGERPLHHAAFALLEAASATQETSYQTVDVACAVHDSMAVACLAGSDCLQSVVNVLFPRVTVTTTVSSAGENPSISFLFKEAVETDAEGEDDDDEAAAFRGAAAAAARPLLNIGGFDSLRALPAQRLAARESVRKRQRQVSAADEALADATSFLRSIRLGLPMWHAKGHAEACQAKCGPDVCPGGGRRAEWAEQVMAFISNAAPQARNMSRHNYEAHWRRMIVLYNSVLEEDASFHVLQELVRASSVVSESRAKLSNALAAAGRASAPSVEELRKATAARLERELDLAKSRKNGGVAKHLAATKHAAFVAAQLAALKTVQALLPPPPFALEARGAGVAGTASGAAVRHAAAADSRNVVLLLQTVPGAARAAGSDCLTRTDLNTRIAVLAKAQKTCTMVTPDEFIIFEVQQIARLWAEFADVTVAIRSPAGVGETKSPTKFYNRRKRLLVKTEAALERISSLQRLAENQDIKKWRLPTPLKALNGDLPSSFGAVEVLLKTSSHDTVVLAALGLERAKEDLWARHGDVAVLRDAFELHHIKLEKQLLALTEPVPNIDAGVGHSGLRLSDTRVLFVLPDSPADLLAPGLAAHINRELHESARRCAEVARVVEAVRELGLVGREVGAFAADSKGRCPLLRRGREMLRGKLAPAAWAALAWPLEPPADGNRAGRGAAAAAAAAEAPAPQPLEEADGNDGEGSGEEDDADAGDAGAESDLDFSDIESEGSDGGEGVVIDLTDGEEEDSEEESVAEEGGEEESAAPRKPVPARSGARTGARGGARHRGGAGNNRGRGRGRSLGRGRGS